MKRPRAKDGKFKPFSELSEKTIGCRIFKADETAFYQQVEQLQLTPAELIRNIVHEWIAENNE